MEPGKTNVKTAGTITTVGIKNLSPLTLTAYFLIACGTALALGALNYLNIELYRAGGYDTAFYVQAFLRLASFQAPTSTLNELFPLTDPINILFGHHFQYSALLYAPFFWLGLDPLTVGLIILPAVTIFLSVFWWAKLFPEKREWLIGSIGLIVLFWGTYSGLFSSEFYFDKLVIPWVLASLYFYRKQRFTSMILMLVIVVGFKEYFALYAVALCALVYFETRRPAAAYWAIIFLLAFVVITVWIMPSIFKYYSPIFHHFGGQPSSPVGYRMAALRAWDRLASLPALSYIVLVLRNYLFLPLLAPRITLLALPVMLATIAAVTAPLAIDKPFRTALPYAVLAVAFVLGFQQLESFLGQRDNKYLPVAALLLVALMVLPWSNFRYAAYRLREDTTLLLEKPSYVTELNSVFASVAPDEMISVSTKLSPYAVANEAFVFPKPFYSPELVPEVDKVIISRHHPSYLHKAIKTDDDLQAEIANLVENGEFEMVLDTQNTTVLIRAALEPSDEGQ